MQRLWDLFFASIALVLVSPLLVGIACVSKATDPGPVLFRQKRIGQDGKPFTMVKFRSLAPDGSPTRIGRLLRHYSLDELPEFWNVIQGHMALVGPRPMIAQDQPTNLRVRAMRQRLRPGMTGWAQINGRNALSFNQTYQLDMWYARHRTFWLDLYILTATVPCVLSGRGACALAETARQRRNRSQKVSVAAS